MNMLKIFLPNQFYHNVYQLTPAYMKQNNLKGLITDLDNTLIRWDRPDATPELKEWFKGFVDAGIKVTICSNNNENRVKKFADQVGLPFVFKARKPLPLGFNRARRLMGLKSHETVVVGDQVMTDMLGGNLGSFHTILVKPIVKTDEWKTYLNRRMESVILAYFKRNNMMKWEE